MKIIIIILFLALPLFSTSPEKIKEECREYGEWSGYLYGIACRETGVNPYRCNTNEWSHGLTQIKSIALKQYNDVYGTSYTIKDLYNYKTAIKITHGLLMDILDRRKWSVYHTIAAYNAGEGKVRKGYIPHDYCKEVFEIKDNFEI